MGEERLAEPRADDMRDDQRGDAQTENELQRLDRAPVKLPALVQRPDAQSGVNQGGAIEHDRDRGKSPEQDVVMQPFGESRHRDIAKRVVEEMAEQIGKQHQATGQANLPEADATNRSC